MKRILIIGAGKSTPTLVKHLLKVCEENDWYLTQGDLSESWASANIQGHPRGRAIAFDVFDDGQRDKEIQDADLVISMLPARFHSFVAKSCLKYGKNMLTASYVNQEIESLHQEVSDKGLLFLMECGLDPGIDHMSAMQVIDRIRNEGKELTGFETFTGGLLAPNPDKDNPWEYKFTWNPRNVVLAGQGSVKFVQEGTYKYIPYHRLFRRFEIIHIPGHGYFEGYGNRDSLKYIDIYGLKGIKTLYRGTLRRPPFCRAWNTFVQLGVTDDGYEMYDVENMTHKQFINSFLLYNPSDSVELKLAHYMNFDLEGEEMYMLRWLGILDDEPIGLKSGTPAAILEHILKKKWTIEADDKDMIVMWHKFDFVDEGVTRQVQSHMVVIGQDTTYTGMAQTVGLPLGVAAELILKGEIKEKGVLRPVKASIYEPILKALQPHGISFIEREIVMS